MSKDSDEFVLSIYLLMILFNDIALWFVSFTVVSKIPVVAVWLMLKEPSFVFEFV